MTYRLLVCCVLFICLSCEKENIADLKKTINIDPIFQPYLDSYISEAEARGVSVPISEKGLTLTFGELEDDLNGRCSTFGTLLNDTTARHEIVIDRSKWDQLTDAYKEFLIFHEMGHCYEYRRHTTDTLSNGEWKSLMRDGTPPFGNSILNFSYLRRDYYIDELFDENIAEPEWTTWTRDYNDIPASAKIVLAKQENTGIFNRFLDLSGNYEIEIEFPIADNLAKGYVSFLWGGSTAQNSHYFGFFDYDAVIFDRINGNGRIFKEDAYFKNGETTKLTVQKIGEYYWYFANEQFLYWSEMTPLNTQRVILATSGASVNSITVKTLPD